MRPAIASIRHSYLYHHSKGMPRISAKNQITIPVRALHEVGLQAGEQVTVEPAGDGVVNLTEVLVSPAADASRLADARQAIALLGVRTHQPGEAIAVDAARLRQRHPVSLADAYCLATAKHTGSVLSSFDRKLLKAGAREGIEAL